MAAYTATSHRSPLMPLDAPKPFLAPEYLESLPAPYTLTPPTPPDVQNGPLHPLRIPIPLMSLYPSGPEHLQSLPAPVHLWHPLHPMSPPIMAPNNPTPPSFLTIFMQLKCSFSVIVIFICHHFATDHLHTVKMLIFYCCHFELSSLCNWPSSIVCPVYNIPSWGVKGTPSVLWSSANFCSISQNMHYKAPVASQH